MKTGFKHATTKNAMSKHKEWVRKFDDLQISARVLDQQEEAEATEARERFKAFNANLRKCILEGSEPVTHPAVRHQVEALERSAAMGLTTAVKEFDEDGCVHARVRTSSASE